MIHIAKPILGEEEKNALTQVIESGILACGPLVDEFEKKFAAFVGTRYAVATNSGTAALHLALLSLGIKKGDEVIVPSFSFIATANSVLFANGIPVFCDVNQSTFNLDIDKIEGLITDKTKAIMLVYLYGQPADMKPVLEIAEKHSLKVIGDACQAHGAKYDGNIVGSFGDAECFSFYPTKNMTTGEGGMITTDNDEVAELVYSLRNHGRKKTKWGYEHSCIGYNYRMTDLAAAIGIEQLKKLPRFIEMRRRNARFLDDNLNRVETPYVLKNVEHVYHQYTIKCKNRERIIQFLKNNEIGYGIYYPKPLHFYEHLEGYGHSDLKNAELLSKNVLSLPVHPALEKKDLEKIVFSVNEASQ